MKNHIARLRCWLRKRHITQKALYIFKGKVYAFKCATCHKPIGNSLGIHKKNNGTSKEAFNRLTAIFLNDRVLSVHRAYDKRKAVNN